MTGEEMERAIEFLLQNQAKFDTRIAQIAQQAAETDRRLQLYAETQSEFIQIATTAIQSLSESQARTDERLTRTAERFSESLRQSEERYTEWRKQSDERFNERLKEIDERLSKRIEQLDEKFSERTARTDERLNRLADLVERQVSERRDSSP